MLRCAREDGSDTSLETQQQRIREFAEEQGIDEVDLMTLVGDPATDERRIRGRSTRPCP